MQIEQIIILCAILPFSLVFILSMYYGKKVLSIFPPIEDENVVFREINATGLRTHENVYKRRSASKVYEVIITDTELWLRTWTIMAWIAKKFGMVHRIKFNQIISAENFNSKADLKFNDDNGKEIRIFLTLKNTEEFLEILNKKLNTTRR